MAGLFRAQQIARAPDLQVPHGDFEAGAKFREIPHGGQPLFGDFRQILVRTVGKVGVSVAGGPAHPAPELVKLAQTEPVRVFDNQGVGVGNVQARFDDGGAYQNLNVAIGHGLHHLAQSVLAHLAVSNTHPQTGNPLLQSAGALVDGLRAVVQVVYLTTPLHLPADGIVNDGVIVLHNKGLHRVAVRRRLLDGGHIPDAGQGHVQGSRDGGGGQGQHVHTLGHLLQPLLVADTEALLLVDDQQAQVLEFYALLNQLVGADDHIHGARRQIPQGLLLLLGGAEPAEYIDVHREAPEPGHGGGVVLLGQHRGGHQNCHLLAVHNGLHHRPECNFRLAEAHVAAEQPVHGGGGFHIPLDVRDAAQLVVGLGIGKVIFKFLLPGGVRGEGEAGLPLPGGIELDQLDRHILGGLPGLGLGFLPGVGADFVQPDVGILAAATDVFAHQIQLGGGDEQGVAALIGDFDVVLDGSIHLDLLHGYKAADTVVLVDHQIAGGQVGKGVQLLAVGRAGFLGGGLALRLTPGDQLTFCENCQPVQGILHAVGQRALAEQNLSRLRQSGQRNADKGGKPLGAEHFLQKLRPPAGAAEYQRAEFLLLVVGQIRSGGVQIAAVAGQLLGGHGEKLPGRAFFRIGSAAEGVEVQGSPAPQSGAEILPLAHIVAQFAHHKPCLKHAVQLHAHFVAAAAGGAVEVRLVAQSHNGILGDIIRRGGHFRINQRQIPVRSGVVQPVFVFFQIPGQGGDQRLIGGFAPLLPGNQAGNIFAQAVDSFRMQTRLCLCHRQDRDGLDIFIAPLGLGVKIAHGVQLVAEKFRPDGLVGGRGEHVQNAAPKGKLSRAFHHAAAAVARGSQPGGQIVHGVFLPHFQGKGGTCHNLRGHGAKAQRLPGHDLQLGPALRQVVELPQALLLPGTGYHSGVIQRQFPPGQNGGRVPQKGFQLLLKPPGGHVILTQHHHRPVRLPNQSGKDMAAVDLTDAGHGSGFVVFQRGQKPGIFRHGFQQGKQLFHKNHLIFSQNVATRKEGKYPSFRDCDNIRHLGMGTVKAVRRFRHAVVNDRKGCVGGIFQRHTQRLLILCGEGGQHPVRQIILRRGLGSHTDLHPGKVLAAQFLNDGLDAVVPAGRAVGPDPQPPRLQRDVVKHHNDVLGRDLEERGQLQNRTSGQIHIGLGLQQEQLAAVVAGLIVQPLKFQFVHLHIQLSGKDVQCPEAAVVAGTLILPAGVSQTHNQPGFAIFIQHIFCTGAAGILLWDKSFSLLYHGKTGPRNIHLEQKSPEKQSPPAAQ